MRHIKLGARFKALNEVALMALSKILLHFDTLSRSSAQYSFVARLLDQAGPKGTSEVVIAQYVGFFSKICINLF